MKDETILVDAGRDPLANHGVVNPPVYRASTILYPSVEAFRTPRAVRGVYYGRAGTPTTFALEDACAALDGAHGAVLTGSGKTVIAQALMTFLKSGDHILVADCAYGPTRQFCDRVLARFGVETTYYDPVATAEVAALIRPETRVLYMESPGSLTFEVQDVPALVEVAKAHGLVTMLDNTWATGLYFKPLAVGVDVALNAGTKYIGGHSDLMLGIATTTEEHYARLRAGFADLGAFVSPDDCYQALRGLRTLAVRLERHQATALELARWFQEQPEVHRVMHPALPDDPGHALWRRDFSGASGLFGVLLEPCPEPAWHAFVDGLAHFGLGASWGGYESLVMPNWPAKQRSATAFDERYPSIRFHAGLEAPEDLIADLERGFRRLRAAR